MRTNCCNTDVCVLFSHCRYTYCQQFYCILDVHTFVSVVSASYKALIILHNIACDGFLKNLFTIKKWCRRD